MPFYIWTQYFWLIHFSCSHLSGLFHLSPPCPDSHQISTLGSQPPVFLCLSLILWWALVLSHTHAIHIADSFQPLLLTCSVLYAISMLPLHQLQTPLFQWFSQQYPVLLFWALLLFLAKGPAQPTLGMRAAIHLEWQCNFNRVWQMVRDIFPSINYQKQTCVLGRSTQPCISQKGCHIKAE